MNVREYQKRDCEQFYSSMLPHFHSEKFKIFHHSQQLFIHSWMKAVQQQRRHIYLLLLYLRAIEYAVGYRKLKGNALKAVIFLDPLRLCCLLLHCISRT